MYGSQPVQPPDASTQVLLLQEAQNQIAILRNELYTTKRLAEERKQEQEAATSQRQQLANVVAELQQKLQAHEVTQQKYSQLQSDHHKLVTDTHNLQGQVSVLNSDNQALQQQLDIETKAKLQAEDAKSRLENERSRTQKARDEYAIKSRLAAQAAEEAEEEAAQLREELAALQVLAHSTPVVVIVVIPFVLCKLVAAPNFQEIERFRF